MGSTDASGGIALAGGSPLTATMRAAVFERPNSPLVVTKIPRPTPGPGEVLVEVAACGFCHTDLHYLDHGVPTAKAPPLVLGHEIAGLVRERGAGADHPPIGAPVLIPAVLPCGACTLCRTGRENVCPHMRMFGNHIDGGFAEYVVAPARDVVRLPPGLDLAESSIIADAVSTAFHAVVNRAQVRAGETVAIIGCGGVGMSAVQIARLAGARVVAVDLQDEKLETAKRLGAEAVLNPSRTSNAAKQLRTLTAGGADVAIEAVGSPATIELGMAALGRGGRLCLIGYQEKPVPLPVGRLMFYEQALIGSLGCRPADYPRILELAQSGRIQLEPLVSHRFALAQINDAANRLRAGSSLRSIIEPRNG